MKKLKWIIPLCVCLLIAVLALALFLRYRSAGEVQLMGISGHELIQIREKGFRKIKLLEGDSLHDPVTSPNERYAVVYSRNGSVTVPSLIDLRAPRDPLFTLSRSFRAAQPTNDGRLILLDAQQRLLLYDGEAEQLLDEPVHRNGLLSPDGQTYFYFRQTGERYNLCRIDLQGGTPEVLLENADPEFLQVAQDERGRTLVCAAQLQVLEGTRYDLVTDALAESDAASHDEAAAARNELRKNLKATAVNRDVRTVFRWVDGARQTLAEGVFKDFYCDARSGRVVYRISALLEPQQDLQDIQGIAIPEIDIWHCSDGSTRFELEPLRGLDSLDSLTFTESGLLAAREERLLHWIGPSCTELTDRVSSFCALQNTAGEEEIYFLTTDHEFYRLGEAAPERISGGMNSAHIPYRTLPDGTKHTIGDMAYLLKYYDETMRNPHVSEVSLLSVGPTPPPMCLYLLQDGVQTPILKVNDYFAARTCLEDGSLVADAGGVLWVLKLARSERLMLSASWRTLWLGPTGIESLY